MMGLGKAHLPAEVATFSRCRDIKGEPQILGSSPTPGPRPLFFSGCNFMMGLGKPKLHSKFEVASISCYRNIKGGPQNCRESPRPDGHAHFSSERLAKSEVAGFIYYGNIKEFVFKNWNKPKWGNPYYLQKLILPLDSQT